MGNITIDKRPSRETGYRFNLRCTDKGIDYEGGRHPKLEDERWWLTICTLERGDWDYFGLAQDTVDFHNMNRNDLRGLRRYLDEALGDRPPKECQPEPDIGDFDFTNPNHVERVD